MIRKSISRIFGFYDPSHEDNNSVAKRSKRSNSINSVTNSCCVTDESHTMISDEYSANIDQESTYDKELRQHRLSSSSKNYSHTSNLNEIEAFKQTSDKVFHDLILKRSGLNNEFTETTAKCTTKTSPNICDTEQSKKVLLTSKMRTNSNRNSSWGWFVNTDDQNNSKTS